MNNSPKGFAAFTPERLQEISRRGGKSAHARGTAHKFAAGSAEAREAGRKGGVEVHRRKRVSDTIPAPPPDMDTA